MRACGGVPGVGVYEKKNGDGLAIKNLLLGEADLKHLIIDVKISTN